MPVTTVRLALVAWAGALVLQWLSMPVAQRQITFFFSIHTPKIYPYLLFAPGPWLVSPLTSNV
jgi:hypothetical protein